MIRSYGCSVHLRDILHVPHYWLNEAATPSEVKLKCLFRYTKRNNPLRGLLLAPAAFLPFGQHFFSSAVFNNLVAFLVLSSILSNV